MQEKDDARAAADTDSVPPIGGNGESGSDADKGTAKFRIGQAVRQRKFGFRGVIFDVDPEFANTDDWYNAIPEDMRPRKNQPFYHLFAVNPADNSPYIAYVSEQNLVPLDNDEDVPHPQLEQFFDRVEDGRWVMPNDRFH